MRLLSLLLVVSTLYSCSNGKTVYIDNPTRDTLHVSFTEGLERIVAPKSSDRVVISSGKTTVFLNGKSVGDITFGGGNSFLLNPLKLNYYIEEVDADAFEYSNEQVVKLLEAKKRMDAGQSVGDIITFEDIPYVGKGFKTNDLLINKDWNFELEDKLPSSPNSNTIGGTNKIYREADFRRHVKKLYFKYLRKAK